MALIMVADDDAAVVALVKDFLESRGHQIVTVSDGLQMAEKAKDWRPHLIISDIMMPNVYGPTAYDILKRSPETTRTPVIFITGLPKDKVERIAPKDPQVRLVFKPIDFAVLEALLKELLAAFPPK